MKTVALLCLLLAARPLFAQDAPSGDRVVGGDGWEPLGQVPVDQAGSGRRGYALASEGSNVIAPGTDQISFHMVAANNFYREQTSDFLITERYETHTLAIGYRRGFKTGFFPRVEIGGQLQLHERDSGFLNGFIAGFEDFWVAMTGRASAKNQLRTSDEVAPPLGTFVSRNGAPIYRAPDDRSGFGDVSVIAKALIADAAPSSSKPRIAARVVVNVSGESEFTDGNFAGIGLSLDKKISGRAAFHGDLRGTLVLDRTSQWNLPLERVSYGFSVGTELKLSTNSSVSLQYEGDTTPYAPTGTAAFDNGYGDITIGLGHRFRAGRGRMLLTQLYARENMNLPFQVRWNIDPDLAVGLKLTIRSDAR